MKLKIKTGRIDLYGMNGRELHPEARDGNSVLEVLDMKLYPIQIPGRTPELDRDVQVQFFLCRTADGRRVEIYEDEIAEFVPVRNGGEVAFEEMEEAGDIWETEEDPGEGNFTGPDGLTYDKFLNQLD